MGPHVATAVAEYLKLAGLGEPDEKVLMQLREKLMGNKAASDPDMVVSMETVSKEASKYIDTV